MRVLNALIADDSAMMRTIVVRAMNQMENVRFEVAHAADGVEALKACYETRFDILFIDWNMPNLDGLKLIQMLRKVDNYRDTPVIMITSNRSLEAEKEATRDGQIDAYVVKPFTADELMSLLEQHLPEALAEE